jgi:hypothetical protein
MQSCEASNAGKFFLQVTFAFLRFIHSSGGDSKATRSCYAVGGLLSTLMARYGAVVSFRLEVYKMQLRALKFYRGMVRARSPFAVRSDVQLNEALVSQDTIERYCLVASSADFMSHLLGDWSEQLVRKAHLLAH